MTSESAIRSGLAARTVGPDVAQIVAAHRARRDALLPILREIGEVRGTLDHATVVEVADALGIPPREVEGVVRFYSILADGERPIRLCGGIACWLAGADRCRSVVERMVGETSREVVRSSCLGLCDRAPAAFFDGSQHGPLSPATSTDRPEDSNVPRVVYEQRFLLEDAGRIDPTSIDDALANGAYEGLRRALAGPPEAVVNEIERSQLRGRGGAGFPTARKWRTVAESRDPIRFVVCNADESEPLMFKDRYLLESDPHLVIEGILIAAFAVGAREGVVYIRGEYEPQARLLERAIDQATERGWMGSAIGGSDFDFELHVHRGAGAYICGEESALLESIEGHRGEPRPRPPYPADYGWHGRPTVVNNVETLATAARIARCGADAFLTHGSHERPGTRLFTLLGHVREPALVEATADHTLREMIDDFGGGMRAESRFGFALTGGAAGTFATAVDLDSRFDDGDAPRVITAGAGGILVCDDTVSPVELLCEVMQFFEGESCGKCTPCRIGTSVVRETLDELLAGRGTGEHLQRLAAVGDTLANTSFCGLGKTAALPLHTALERLSERFEGLVS